jgi:uncharacterized membrane protein YkvI
MEKSQTTKVRWALVIGTAFAWFGQHCGAGFCSGVQVVTYHGKVGYLALFTTTVPFIILGFAFYLMGEYARRIKAKSYKDIACTLYSNNPAVSRVMLFLWDLSVLSNVLISGGAVVAGAATLMNQQLGINYVVTSILFAVVVAVICMFGAVGLTRISLPLVGILVVTIAIVSGVLISENWQGLEAVMVNKNSFDATPWTAFTNMIFYTGLASNFICAFLAIAPNYNSKRETRIMAVSGALLNAGMLLILSLALLSRMPDIAVAKLPVFAMIAERFGNSGALTVIYQLGLLLAYITTGVGNVFAAISRFGSLVNKNQKYNQKAVDGIMALAFLIIAVGVAQFGLAALVDKGYKFLSSLRFPLYVLGALIFVPIRFHKMKKKEFNGVLEENESYV